MIIYSVLSPWQLVMIYLVIGFVFMFIFRLYIGPDEDWEAPPASIVGLAWPLSLLAVSVINVSRRQIPLFV